MKNQQESKTQAQILKEMREKHSETVAETQKYLKEQQSIRKTLKQVMAGSEMTVPEIAAEAGLPANIVLWHVVAMKKYDQVKEAGTDGEYYQYTLADKKEPAV